MLKHSKLDPNEWNPPLLAIVGMGMGKDDLTFKTLAWIERAEVLAGGKRHLEWFPEHPGIKVTIQPSFDAFLVELDAISTQRRTVVLASGDPLFFGIARRLLARMGRERIAVFPNVTSVQALFGRLAEPWEDVTVVSLHGRNDRPAKKLAWLRQIRGHSRMVFLTDPNHTPAWIAERMLEAGIGGRTFVVAEDLGLPSEQIHRLSMDEVVGRRFSALNIVAVLPPPGEDRVQEETPEEQAPVMGIAEDAFRHEAGLITKTEVRAVVLAHLQLQPGLVVWDLGAASGSVSIEASRIVSLKEVIAVEKNERRYLDLLENVKRFHCARIRPLHGNVSELAGKLPDPDRVFIGGSGGELLRILEIVAARLRSDGVVVQTAVTVESLAAAAAFWQDRSFDLSIVQVQINRSVPIGEALRLEASNPVFVISARRKNSGRDVRSAFPEPSNARKGIGSK